VLVLEHLHLLTRSVGLFEIVDILCCRMTLNITRACRRIGDTDRLGELIVPATTVGTGPLVSIAMVEITREETAA
jgi:hypothetical protein